MNSNSMVYSRDDMTGHKITEQDIQGVLNYLKIFHPDKASREVAEDLLRYMKLKYRRQGLSDPDALEDLFDELEKSKRNTDQ